MNVLIFGATGMVGQGVLRECLQDPDIKLVQTVGRTPTGTRHPKLRELLHQDLWNYKAVEGQLSGFDACFFCVGVTSTGMTEAEYSHVTYDMTVAVGETLSRLNPQMTFVFVSGASTDSSEKGRLMWARIKGKAENALLRMPFKAAYMFRPGLIQPLHGIQSKTASYRIFYSLAKPVMPALRAVLPKYITTTEELGRAMIAVSKQGAPKRILENTDIGALARP